MGRKVVVTDHVFADLETERSILERHGCELELAESIDEDALVAAVEGAAALLVCFAKVGERVVDAAAASTAEPTWTPPARTSRATWSSPSRCWTECGPASYRVTPRISRAACSTASTIPR
jgi:hypothetical protein